MSSAMQPPAAKTSKFRTVLDVTTVAISSLALLAAFLAWHTSVRAGDTADKALLLQTEAAKADASADASKVRAVKVINNEVLKVLVSNYSRRTMKDVQLFMSDTPGLVIFREGMDPIPSEDVRVSLRDIDGCTWRVVSGLNTLNKMRGSELAPKEAFLFILWTDSNSERWFTEVPLSKQQFSLVKAEPKQLYNSTNVSGRFEGQELHPVESPLEARPDKAVARPC